MKRILIVEDEKPLRDAFALLLDKAGYDIELAENGKIAITKLKSFKPDLVLLDMLMPIMNGMTFLKTAKLPSKYPKTKVVVLSNLSDAVDNELAERYGVLDTVLKADLSPKQLLSMIDNKLSA